MFAGLNNAGPAEEQKAVEPKPVASGSAFDFMGGSGTAATSGSNPLPESGDQLATVEPPAHQTAPEEPPKLWGAAPEAPKPSNDAPSQGLSGLGLFSGMQVGLPGPQQAEEETPKQTNADSQGVTEPPAQAWGAPQA